MGETTESMSSSTCCTSAENVGWNLDAMPTRTAPMISPCGYQVALLVCCSNSLLYTRIWYDHSGSSNVPKFQTAMCHMLPPVSVAHQPWSNRLYLRYHTSISFVQCLPYLLRGSAQIRVVVINSQISPRHVAVPVILVSYCRTSLMSNPARSLLAYRSTLCAKSSQSILTYLLKIPM